MATSLVSVSSCAGWQLESAEIETFDGRQLSCQLESISSAGQLSGDQLPQGISVKDLLLIRNPGVNSTPKRNVEIQLSGGGKIFVSDFTTDGQHSRVISQTVVGKFPLEATKAVIWRADRKVQTALSNRSSEFDQVVVDTGDDQVIVSGLLEEVTEEKVSLNYKGESRTISRSIVLAIVTADLQPKSPNKTIGVLEMSDGSIIQGGIDSFANGVMRVLLDDRNIIEIDTAYLDNIAIKSDRILFASAMSPVEFDQRSYFGIARPWQRDKSVEGNPLLLNSVKSEKPIEFKRGIGMQSYSRMVFDIPENFNRFAATLGIDAETGGKGDCEVIIQADGIQIWQGRVKADDEPAPVEVDITDSKQLTLIVLPGKQYDLSDHLNWCNARFLNTK